MGGGVCDEGWSAGTVNLPDRDVVTGDNHVVTKCAHMVEGNPGFVLSAGWHHGKRGGDTPCDFIDPRALGDENVARDEPGNCGLGWSDSDVFLSAITDSWKSGQQRNVALAVERIDIVAAVFGHNQIGARSGHAYGGVNRGKGSWISSVKDYCQRQ